MKRISNNLGRKHSEARKQRQRDQIAQRKAAGLRVGPLPDPRTRFEQRICQLPSCSKEFTFKIRPATDPNAGRYCCQKHAVRHVSILRRKVPADYDLLYDLYVVKNMTTVEIAAMFDTTHGSVRHRLLDVGIRPRKVGISRHKFCTVKGCGEPVLKLWHVTSKSWYGTKCADHRRAHRYAGRWEYRLRKTGNRPAQVLRALEAGATTSREVSERTELSIKIACTTIGHLHRRGEVECYGSVRINRAEQKLWRLTKKQEQAA